MTEMDDDNEQSSLHEVINDDGETFMDKIILKKIWERKRRIKDDFEEWSNYYGE